VKAAPTTRVGTPVGTRVGTRVPQVGGQQKQESRKQVIRKQESTTKQDQHPDAAITRAYSQLYEQVFGAPPRLSDEEASILSQLVRERSEPQVLGALRQFIADQYARDNGLPIRLFRKQIDAFIRKAAAVVASEGPIYPRPKYLDMEWGKPPAEDQPPSTTPGGDYGSARVRGGAPSVRQRSAPMQCTADSAHSADEQGQRSSAPREPFHLDANPFGDAA
jgi:hypothetical protein